MQPAIPTDLVRHELDAVCGSAAFVRSPQHQRLLRYLVQELLADRLANLREIHLGVHIFRRAAARFDPATDSTVRVEARRLRVRLKRYYANAGADARVVIELPLGSYIPLLRWVTPPPDDNRLRPVLAVLPLDGLGSAENSDIAAWSDALTEEITDALARLPDLRVVARTSAMQFKHVRRDIREIATALSADILIEGSLQQEHDQLRAIVQIVAANDGLHLWSDSVVGAASARFHFFDTVTAMVRSALPTVIMTLRHEPALKVTNIANAIDHDSPHPQSLAVASTPTPVTPLVTEAVRDLFERGNIAVRVRTTESITRATALFLRVTTDALDFARGHAAYASALLQQAGMTMRAASDVAPLIRSAATRALSLDPQLPEAHATLGMFSFYYEHDWPNAERSLLRAIQFGPSYVSAHRAYAFGLTFMRRFDEAERNFSNARALDPLDAQTRVHQGMLCLYQRRFVEACAVFEGMLDADANNVIARTLLAYTSLHSGDALRAEQHYRETIVHHPDLSIGHCGLAVTLALDGRIDEAKRSQKDLVNYAKTAFVSPYQFAMVECALGNDLAALSELERAAVACDYNFLCSAVDPIFDRLHGTADWIALMRLFGLPEH